MMPARARLAVFTVCADNGTLEAVVAAAQRVAGAQFVGEFRDYITAGKRPQFSSSLTETACRVAVIDFDRDAEAALETAARLQTLLPAKTPIIGVACKMDAGLLLRAMRSGCAEFLSKPTDAAELDAAFARLFSATTEAAPARRQAGRVLALSGAKGGVGTTVLSVHLATYLVRMHGARTLLVDTKPHLGHAGLFLGLRQMQYHFDDLLRNAARLDAGVLSGLVVRHKSGLDVVTSPEIEGSLDPRPEQLSQVMDFLRSEYEYVVLDCATALNSARSPIPELTDEIYAIATPDIAALRDLARLVERLSSAESTAGKPRIVVNRSTSTDAVNAEQIEKAVRSPIAVSVPNNYVELLRAINDGEPVPPQRRSEFSQAIARWAEDVASESARPNAVPEKRGLLSFLNRGANS